MRARECDLKTYSSQELVNALHQMRGDMVDFGDQVDVGEWQGTTKNAAANRTWELRNVTIDVPIPSTEQAWVDACKPNLPWAEEHFQERVSGAPLNPPPSHVDWPFASRDNDDHMVGGMFSHTYPERFWPKRAGLPDPPDKDCYTTGDGDCVAVGCHLHQELRGVRFAYGDLLDLVFLLNDRPLTRQAYLPVWFPEDLTAARAGHRVPCTLGYHFLIRNRRLSCTYHMRSCDLERHFRDDAYMAGRLTQWICYRLARSKLPHLTPGDLTMHVASMHVFQVDMLKLKREMGVPDVRS